MKCDDCISCQVMEYTRENLGFKKYFCRNIMQYVDFNVCECNAYYSKEVFYGYEKEANTL